MSHCSNTFYVLQKFASVKTNFSIKEITFPSLYIIFAYKHVTIRITIKSEITCGSMLYYHYYYYCYYYYYYYYYYSFKI